MSTIRRLALATTLTLATGAAFVGTARADEFWGRYHNQQDRIEQGVDNGSLTRGEANRLENQEQQLRRERERLAHNGLSGHDRQVLNRDLDRESRAIHSQRTDDQRAGRGWDDDRDHHHHHGDNDWYDRR
jgi:Spy/CpxP family protein refolding chaperone